MAMGLDACLFVKGTDITPDQIDDATAYLDERLAGHSVHVTIDEDHWRPSEPAVTYVELTCGERYYSPSYHRGQWPRIHHAMVCLRAAFPGQAVFYAIDSPWDGLGTEVTDELLAQFWASWLGPGGATHHRESI